MKNSNQVRPQDLRSLAAFRDDYPEGQALLYRGTELRLVQGIRCMPIDCFLQDLRPGQPLAAELESPGRSW